MQNPAPTARVYYSVSEAASVLGVSESWLNKKRLSGGGPAFLKFGRRVLYDPYDLDTWAAENRYTISSEWLPSAPPPSKR